MKIPIVDNIIMTADTYNIILNKEVMVKKTGKKELKPYRYFNNIACAFRDVLDMKLKESEATSLKELLAEYRELAKEFRGMK